jgi:hypothetical protein
MSDGLITLLIVTTVLGIPWLILNWCVRTERRDELHWAIKRDDAEEVIRENRIQTHWYVCVLIIGWHILREWVADQRKDNAKVNAYLKEKGLK